MLDTIITIFKVVVCGIILLVLLAYIVLCIYGVVHTIFYVLGVTPTAKKPAVSNVQPILDPIIYAPKVFSVTIEIGKTTRECLTYALGPPETFNANIMGETLTWTFKPNSPVTIEFYNPPATMIKLQKKQLAVVLVNNIVISIAT